MIRERIYQLDGLRAIAVILVVFYHLNIYTSAIPGYNLLIENGGRLGVILFFILSGYLMSKFYVAKNVNEVKIPSFRTFYISRFIRIMPLYIISTTVFYLFRNHIDLYNMQNITINITEFISGLLFLNDKFLILNPVIWTLKIEIIFYIIFPLIGYLLHYWHVNRKYLFQISFPLLIMLLSTSFRYLHKFGESSFFTNLDGLAAGILAAVILCTIARKNIIISASILYIIIFAALALMGVFLNFSSSTFLQPAILSILLSIVFIGILLLPKESLVVKMLSNRLFYYAALLSYSIYVWHFNIYYNVSKPLINNLPISIYHKSMLSSVVAIFITIFISYFTYHAIEKPFIKIKGKF